MKRMLLWFALMNKRLFKRVSFWLILAAVPLLVLALGLLAQQESGVTTVALYAEDEADPAAEAILARLTEGKSVMRCVRCDSERETKRLVSTGRADVAWIFPKDLSARIDARAGGEDTRPITSSMTEPMKNALSICMTPIIPTRLIGPSGAAFVTLRRFQFPITHSVISASAEVLKAARNIRHIKSRNMKADLKGPVLVNLCSWMLQGMTGI